jgi:uncharacterized membrane protein (UPF0127 family)
MTAVYPFSMFVRIGNRSKDTILGERVEVADTARTRSRGLLGSDGWRGRDGMFLSPCRNVHTFGMRYPIDVAFLDVEDVVLKVVHGLRPGRISPVAWRARRALELPAGRLLETSTEAGDRLFIESGGQECERQM